jgi:hypothetical protein
MSFFTNQLPGNYCGSAGGYSAWQIAGRGHADPQAGTLPANDGGYLVGAMASQPGLFASDGTGTANALEALLTRARALSLSVHLTDPFYETDIAADLNQQMIGILAELDKPETKLEWTLCTRPCTYGSSARGVFCSSVAGYRLPESRSGSRCDC